MNKYDSKVLEQVIDNISRVKEYSDKLSELQATDTETFWKALKKIINKSREGSIDLILSTLEKKGSSDAMGVYGDVKFMAGGVRAYDEVLSLVDKNAEVCAQACARIKELEEAKQKIEHNIEIQ
jgi:transcription elongation factor GreA-like protein